MRGRVWRGRADDQRAVCRRGRAGCGFRVRRESAKGRGQGSSPRSIDRFGGSPSRFVRVQRVQREWARGAAKVSSGVRARDELDVSLPGGAARGPGGARGGRERQGDEFVLTLAVFDAFAGWPKTTERRSAGRMRAFPARRSDSRFSSASSSSDTSSPLSPLYCNLRRQHARVLLTRIEQSRAERQGEHEDIIRPARYKGLARQGTRPNVSTHSRSLLAGLTVTLPRDG